MISSRFGCLEQTLWYICGDSLENLPSEGFTKSPDRAGCLSADQVLHLCGCPGTLSPLTYRSDIGPAPFCDFLL